MGTIYDSFEQELAAWDQRYLNSPEEEMVALCLLALEREELVAVGYREEVILKRLASMRVSDDVRDVIHHSLIWAWKDEEMHAVYVRGAILRLGSRTLRLQAFARQMAGAIAGWSSSVCQHVSWRAAPISRTVASMITGLGSLLGKVPRGVRRHLVYGAFRNFCDFNVDAEKTAWLCWKRMAELAEVIPGLQSYAVSDFRRVQADEERHAPVFQALADALGDDDALAEGESAETLAAASGASRTLSAYGKSMRADCRLHRRLMRQVFCSSGGHDQPG